LRRQEIVMPTREDIAALLAASDNAECEYMAALKVLKVARVDASEALKEATRARMKYNRTMGAMLADEGEDDDAP
jgi:hypothetical protein